MEAADMIKKARKGKMTQQELAEQIGVTSGFIAKIESGKSLPSYERCIALGEVLGLSVDDLWDAVEKARAEQSQLRVRTRGEVFRKARRSLSTDPSPSLLSGTDMAADDDLQEAYRNLDIALANRQIRLLVLKVLRDFAETASTN